MAYQINNQLDLLKTSVAEWNQRRHDCPEALIELCLATLRGADLRGATLRGADLTGASLINANLSGATLSEANFDGAGTSGCIGCP